MRVVAKSPLRVVQSLDSRNLQDSAETVSTLAPGRTVNVVACKNLKDDQVYRVQLGDETHGWVVGGDFEIQHNPSWSGWDGPRVICF